MKYMQDKTLGINLAAPDFEVETPCFIIIESAVQYNLKRAAEFAGGVNRLVPHVKTHRSPWITKYLVENGVKAFKAATPREVEMVLDSGSPEVIWAYPTSNPAAISRVLRAAASHPQSIVCGLVDNDIGLSVWTELLTKQPLNNVTLRVDLDPGLGRTGLPISDIAIELAEKVAQTGRFAGWHIYDGHLKDLDLSVREAQFLNLKDEVDQLFDSANRRGLTLDVIGGGSYTYPFWARHTEARVSPGSWTFSSCQHHTDLSDQGWEVGAYVLATVLSKRDGTVTLDAGSKAVAPDITMTKRYTGVNEILDIKEEHSVVAVSDENVGDHVALVPRHACTTTYLYRKALVLSINGEWEWREQLGCER
ncbi:alanine racemase [Pantoea endophytica]|uniref:alanine racemase n=1 Tax=Pantoea endophytica TaxID=92488 RepID=UPI002413AEEC|nr:alanine racemase [Pantoea endophytica]